MTKQEVIDLAMSNYPGGDDIAGDTLALFIRREISDTFEPDRPDSIQISIAAHALQRAIEDLQAAQDPFCKRLKIEKMLGAA